MRPYEVLHERWRPKRWRASYIGPRLLRLCLKHGLVPLDDDVHGPQFTSMWCDPEFHAEVRRNTPDDGQGSSWHQDGDLVPGANMNHAEVVWASSHPTQFLVGDKHYGYVTYQPRPYEVVISRNLGCYHRRPPDAPEKRFFFRMRCEVPEWLWR